MEKARAHHRLEDLQAEVQSRGLQAFTRTALDNIRAMGLTTSQATVVLMQLGRRQFYKSMTTHANPRIWQDVYHAPCPNGRYAYIKLTLQDGAVVVQFKEK